MKILLIILTAFSFFTNPAQAEDAKVINICYHDLREEVVTAVLLTAEQKGAFTKENLKINWIKSNNLSKAESEKVFAKSNFDRSANENFFNGVLSESALLQNAEKNNCDIISTTFEATIGSGIKIDPYLPVAAYRYGKDYDVPVVVRAESSIKTIKDLKGKTIRVNQVGSFIPFIELLKNAGLSINDLKYKKVSLSNLPQSLDRNELDVVLSYNPTVPLLLGSGRVRILEPNLFSKYYSYPVPHSILLAKKEFMNSNRALYDRLMKVFSTTATEISSNPSQLVDIFSAIKGKYTPAQIEKSLAYLKVNKPLIRDQSNATTFFDDCKFSEYGQVLKDHNFLKENLNLAAWK